MRTILLLCFLLPFCNGLDAQGLSKRAFKKEIKKHRKAYKGKFLEEQRSPFYGKPKALRQLKFYKANRDYQTECSFTATPDAEVFDMATYSGATRKYVQYGTLVCPLKKGDVHLAVYRNLMLVRMPKYKNHLFIPFKDATNDETTYGGGRYMDIELTDIVDNKIVIDFNKCYNPWCAFSDGYSCPIPPRDNHLEMAITAGEKKYAGKH